MHVYLKTQHLPLHSSIYLKLNTRQQHEAADAVTGELDSEMPFNFAGSSNAAALYTIDQQYCTHNEPELSIRFTKTTAYHANHA